MSPFCRMLRLDVVTTMVALGVTITADDAGAAPPLRWPIPNEMLMPPTRFWATVGRISSAGTSLVVGTAATAVAADDGTAAAEDGDDEEEVAAAAAAAAALVPTLLVAFSMFFMAAAALTGDWMMRKR